MSNPSANVPNRLWMIRRTHAVLHGFDVDTVFGYQLVEPDELVKTGSIPLELSPTTGARTVGDLDSPGSRIRSMHSNSLQVKTVNMWHPRCSMRRIALRRQGARLSGSGWRLPTRAWGISEPVKSLDPRYPPLDPIVFRMSGTTRPMNDIAVAQSPAKPEDGRALSRHAPSSPRS